MIPSIEGGRWISNRSRNRSFAIVWGLLAGATAIIAVALLVSGLRVGKTGGGLAVFALFSLAALAREGVVWNSEKNVVGWVAVARELNALVQSAS